MAWNGVPPNSLILSDFNNRVGRDSMAWNGVPLYSLILCDFNNRVGRDSMAWNGVLGRHGVGN